MTTHVRPPLSTPLDATALPAEPGLWSTERRKLTIGLVLTITLVAFEALAIATVMPQVKDDLGGLRLYGWVFSGFFLASILGIVVAGQLADRKGLVLPFSAGLVLFAGGLAMGGAAGSMGILVLARLAQGFGAGAIPATAYAAIGRGYPPSLRPRMFATTATAWVVPGLVGPVAATVIEQHTSWRWVFLGLLPIVAVALVMTTPALRALDAARITTAVSPRTQALDRRRLRLVMVLVAGVGAMLAAGTDVPGSVAILLLVTGGPLVVWAFMGLVPKGTLTLAPGVPATIGVRGVLTWAFFSADAYVPLAITDGRGAATWVAGAALSSCCVLWAAGSWVQARLIDQLGPRRLDQLGFSLLAAAVIGLLAMSQGLPTGVAVVSWGLGGLAMGMAYAPLSVTVLASVPPGEEGTASASLQLSDTLGVALGTGFGGWIIALGDEHAWQVSSSVGAAFAVSLGVAVLGIVAAHRLPRAVPSTPLGHGTPDALAGL